MNLYRWALKLGYLGWKYSGFQRQPNRKAIENIIIEILQKEGFFDDYKKAKYNFASRTDKGVSAIGQVVSFNSTIDRIILPKVNRLLPDDIWIFGYKQVADNFNPRKDAIEKHYRYLIIYEGDISTLKEAAVIFEGTHDFKNLSKRDRKRAENTIRNIRKIEVKEIYPNLVAIDFFGKSFLWEQIRRVVRVVLDIANDKISKEDVKEVLEGKKTLDIKPMPGEGLILMNIKYDFDFIYDEKMLKYMSKKIVEATCRHYTYYGVAKTIKEKIEDLSY